MRTPPPLEVKSPEPPVRRDAAHLLASFGADPSSSSATGSALESLFIELQERFNPLVGREGYRALLQEAHRRAVRRHAVLEAYPVSSRGNPFFGGLGSRMAEEDPGEVWRGLTALTEEFLGLARSMGRKGEVIRRRPRGEDAHPPPAETRLEPHPSDALPSGKPWRVVVLDRDQAVCESTARSLCQAPDFEVVSRCLTAREAQEKLRGNPVDFIVVDARVPSREILQVCGWLRSEDWADPPRVVVTGLPEDPAVLLSFLEAGAAAFTMEEFSVPGLRVTLRLLAREESVFPLRLQHLMSLRISELAELVRDRGLEPDLLWTLTAREGEVLLLLDKDLTNRQIARRLYISEGTVKSHVHQILRKLKVRDREEAVRILQFHRAVPGKLILNKTGFEREAKRASA